MKPSIDAELNVLQRQSFGYFLHETNPANGLVIDKTAENWPASIAATGLALACYPVSVERGFMTRAAAVARTLATLRFFWNSPQSSEPDATGYKGFYYHFLDMQTGRRAWHCELSTVDSAFLLAGALTAGAYFNANTLGESEIRTLADALYCRADWRWAQNQGDTVTHGWKPESGFLSYRWEGYDEALLLYILGLGSPTHTLAQGSYAAWATTYRWENHFGQEYLYAGSLRKLRIYFAYLRVLCGEGLLDHLGYKIQPGFDLGRNRLKGFVLVMLGDPVFAQAQGQILGVGHGRDTICIDGLHLLHQAHNIGKLGQHRRDFLFLDFDPGEVGHALHIGFGQ